MNLYAAYGSNLNKSQMKRRCPDSSPYVGIVLKNWRLVFKGVADIEKKKKSNLFLGLYKITNNCEQQLDVYEEYPEIYKKYYFNHQVNGKNELVMLYIMSNKFNYSVPTQKYFQVIEAGYADWRFDKKFLFSAGEHSIISNTINGYKSKNWDDKCFLNKKYLRNNVV